MIKIPTIIIEALIITIVIAFIATILIITYKAIEYYKTPEEDVKKKHYNNKNS